MELDEALGEIRDQTGIEQFEMIGLDACLMGQLEVFDALAPHARYAVASEETEPALGWAYTGFLEELGRNPDMDGAELGRLIVDSYIQDDQRIVDDQARADLLKQGSPMGGLFGLFGAPTAEQVAQQMEQSSTLTAVDLAAMPQLMDSVNNLSFSLQQANQQDVARARTYAQSFTSVFGRKVPPSYIDLGSFAQLLKRESGDSRVAQAADQVLASLDQSGCRREARPQKAGRDGRLHLLPQFPALPLARHRAAVLYRRRATALPTSRCGTISWPIHYTGRTFEPAAGTVAVPDRGATVTAPGAGQIEVSPISLSDNVAAPGQPVLLSTDISGENIGYVHLFVGFYDRESNAIFVADRDYLESADTREIDGVYYPVWPDDGEFTMEFEWEPIVFAISDGVDSVVALFTPQSYGASFEDAVYTVDGIYTYADGESRYARLYFSDGMLRQVFGFTGEGGTGAPREIIPQTGDTFTILEKWMDLDQNGKVTKVATQEGGTLTFGDQMFTWEDLDAAPGDYIVGFAVEDLDGNAVEVYERVQVQ